MDPKNEKKNEKKNDDVVSSDEGVSAVTYVTVFDGTRAVYIRRAAIDAIYALGEPPTQIRILLRSGEAVIVNWTEAAKTELLDAIG